MWMRQSRLLVILLASACLLPLASGVKSSVDIAKKFLDAVETGDLAGAKSFLDQDPCLVNIGDIRYKGGDLTPVLHLAIYKEHPDLVKLLLSRGADVNSKNIEDLGPLHVAAKQGCSEIVPILVVFGADPNGKRGNFRFPPLGFAANAAVAQTLIAYGADVHLRNENGFTPLHLLAQQGKVSAAEVLLDHQAEIEVRDNWGKTPLHGASEYGQPDMIEFLLEKGADINARDKQGLTAVNRAAQSDYLAPKEARKKCAELLMSKGAEYTISDVVWLGDSTRVEKLLENNPALGNAAVLVIATKEGHANIVERLITAGADLNANLFKDPLLHVAAYSGHVGVARVLLDKGINVNQKGTYGELALHWAAAKGHTDVAELLLEAGSEINIPAEKQRGDIDVIVKEEVDPVSEQLKFLELQAKQKQADRAGSGLQIAWPSRVVFAVGDTPLHSAVQCNHDQMVKTLIAAGADVNARNKFGDTPLHYASVFRNKEIIKVLLGAGADVNARDSGGHTPLWLASSPADSKDDEIVKMLVVRGAVK
jgi:ankyrin repeat protein